jgi:hypothetical protein
VAPNGTCLDGCPYPALRRLENLCWDLDAEADPEEAKLLAKLEEFIVYLENNHRVIVNYGLYAGVHH